MSVVGRAIRFLPGPLSGGVPLVEPDFVEGPTSQLMPTTRKQTSDWQSWPPIWFFAGWPSSPGALGKWFVKSALSLGDFRSH
jgi:hypothetical protein